jgi:hypothetical protein
MNLFEVPKPMSEGEPWTWARFKVYLHDQWFWRVRNVILLSKFWRECLDRATKQAVAPWKWENARLREALKPFAN